MLIMRKINPTAGWLGLFLLLFFGCSKEDIYNMTQPEASFNYQRKCSEVPRSQQSECKERAMSFKEYEKAREEALGEKTE